MRDGAPPEAISVPLRRPRWLASALSLAVWSLVWIALWRLASILAVSYGVSAWYPPAAVSLFLTIRHGAPAAAAVFAASLAAGAAQWRAYPGLHEVLGSLFHAAAYLAAAWLYRRDLRGHVRSIRPETVVRLLYAAPVGAVLSAVLGNLNIHLAGAAGGAIGFDRVLGWAVGDLFGVLSLCPLLLFVGPRVRWRAPRRRGSLTAVGTPLAALLAATALAALFAAIARGSDLDVRLLVVVAVGVFSVIVANSVSPRSAVIYLFLLGCLSAAWLSTEVAPAARIEVAVQICTFLGASLAMIGVSLRRAQARVAVASRRRRIRDLSAQRDALDRRIAAIEAEFAQLAHELKTPLGGIIGLLDVAEGGLAAGDQRARFVRYFDHMRGCARHLNAMVDDAFDVARLSRGRLEPAFAEVDLAGLFEELALIGAARFGEGVRFPEAASLAGLRVRTDRGRLLQILINLLVNAVRYADRRGTVELSCAVGGDSVTLSVRNASAAMTKARLDAHIAGGQALAENSQGLGIGLPLVGRLAAGIGATFSTAVDDGVVTVSVTVARA